MKHKFLQILAAVVCAFMQTVVCAQAPVSPSALAQVAPIALMTEKKVFELSSYTTFGGKAIRQVKIGYETYGKLNAAGDNAVFIAHFYSGNSHAAGKYKPSDVAAGYWDAIIGISS
jgi:homoserine O-acetyltransferase/O-succinyltransferase